MSGVNKYRVVKYRGPTDRGNRWKWRVTLEKKSGECWFRAEYGDDKRGTCRTRERAAAKVTKWEARFQARAHARNCYAMSRQEGML